MVVDSNIGKLISLDSLSHYAGLADEEAEKLTCHRPQTKHLEIKNHDTKGRACACYNRYLIGWLSSDVPSRGGNLQKLRPIYSLTNRIKY